MTQRKLDLSKQASNFLTDLPAKQCKQNLDAILKLIKNVDQHDSKKLKGYDDLYRVDVGEYRIVYRFDKEVVSICLIGKRNDDEIYNQLRRKFSR